MIDVAVIALQATDGGLPADTGLGAARAVVALVAVLVLLGGFLWLLRRGTLAAASRGGRQVMAVESAISLGDRRSLVIVSVEGRRLLLGVAPAQVALVTELAPPAPAPSFGTALAGALSPDHREART